MPGRLEGKVCVITGAGGGMGREAAIVFTGEGARVCVADVNLPLAEETVGLCPPGSAFAVEVNVASEDAVKAMYAATADRFGGMKQSGFGRELGMAGLDGYCDIKNVFISTEG